MVLTSQQITVMFLFVWFVVFFSFVLYYILLLSGLLFGKQPAKYLEARWSSGRQGHWFKAQSLPSCCFLRSEETFPKLSFSTQVYKWAMSLDKALYSTLPL